MEKKHGGRTGTKRPLSTSETDTGSKKSRPDIPSKVYKVNLVYFLQGNLNNVLQAYKSDLNIHENSCIVSSTDGI